MIFYQCYRSALSFYSNVGLKHIGLLLTRMQLFFLVFAGGNQDDMSQPTNACDRVVCLWCPLGRFICLNNILLTISVLLWKDQFILLTKMEELEISTGLLFPLSCLSLCHALVLTTVQGNR